MGIKRFVILLLALAIGLGIVFFIINQIDDELRPEVQAIFSEEPEPDSKLVEAYAFKLGLFAPLSMTPEELGQDVLNRIVNKKTPLYDKNITQLRLKLTPSCATRGFCVEEQYRTEEAKSLEELEKQKLFHQRFNKLIEYGGMEVPGAGHMTAQMFLGAKLQELTQIKFLDLNRLVHNNSRDAAKQSLQKLHDFYVTTINRSRSRFGISLGLASLQAVVRFALEASLPLDISGKNQILSREELSKRAIQNELHTISSFLATDPNGKRWLPPRKGGLAARPTQLTWLGERFLMPNKTINDYYESALAPALEAPTCSNDEPCLSHNEPRSSLKSRFINPMGHIYINALKERFTKQLKRMNSNTSQLALLYTKLQYP